MPRNDDGEFELILGNRQLMSVFFIVVILLGVFFTMGYIVGRNSSPVGAPEVAARQADTKPVDADASSSTKRETTKEAPADVPKERIRSPRKPRRSRVQRPRPRRRPSRLRHPRL